MVVESTMRSFGEAAAGREPTPEEHAKINFVLSMASEFVAGTISLADVRRQSTGLERATCARFCCRDARSFPDLWAMFDALVDSEVRQDGECYYRTKHGVFSTSEIREVPHRYGLTGDGRVVPVFTGEAR